ncbi:MAG: restriction endonuclease subunit S [Acidobacteriia bacterium]|nr:restriction endonuclease subunit S [Terriglobia bacterium]
MSGDLRREAWHASLAKLDECGELFCGQSPSVSEVNEAGRGHPYFTGPEQWDGQSLRVEKWTEFPRRLVPDRCIFITVKGAGVGKLFPGAPGAIGRDIYAFHVHKEIDFRYVLYALNYSIAEVIGQAKGDIPGLSRGHIVGHSIYLPGPQEQRSIVAKIDEVFSELDKGFENLAAAREQIKAYRHALLKYAFEGKLTAEWRAANRDKLVQPDLLLTHLQEERQRYYETLLISKRQETSDRNEGGGLRRMIRSRPKRSEAPVKRFHEEASPSCWTYVTLRDLALDASLGKMLDREKNRGHERVYLGNINVRWGSFDLDYSTTMKIEDREVSRYALRKGDLVICEGGEPGRCAVWQGADDEVFIQKALHRVRFPAMYEPRFGYLYVLYANSTGKLEELFTGSTIKHLTGEGLRQVTFPLCSGAEQAEIIRIVEQKLSLADELENELESAINRASAFRQSVLRRAFSGRLVPHDPNDVPASTLLECIRAEREAKSSKPKKTTRHTKGEAA